VGLWLIRAGWLTDVLALLGALILAPGSPAEAEPRAPTFRYLPVSLKGRYDFAHALSVLAVRPCRRGGSGSGCRRRRPRWCLATRRARSSGRPPPPNARLAATRAPPSPPRRDRPVRVGAAGLRRPDLPRGHVDGPARVVRLRRRAALSRLGTGPRHRRHPAVGGELGPEAPRAAAGTVADREPSPGSSHSTPCAAPEERAGFRTVP
jgi:hypothetical protein